MIAVKETSNGDGPSILTRMLQKSQPEKSSTGDYRLKRFAQSEDIVFISGRRTELTPQGKRQPSAIIVSSLGRHILKQQPTFLRTLFDGSYPQQIPDYTAGPIGISSGSLVRTSTVLVNGGEQSIVIKYHGEGDSCYPHIRTNGSNKVYPDRISGIDNFLALRAIDLFAPNLSAPEPILATRRIFMASLVEGQWVDSIPRWVQVEVSRALEKAYQLGWLSKPDEWLGLFPRHFRIDLKTGGNVLKTAEGRFFIIDPIL